MTRPRLSVFIACSLDGFIADDSGRIDWLQQAAAPDEDYGYDDFMSGIDALAMGRLTYDTIADLEPLPFGERPVYVFTHTAATPRSGVTFWSPSPHEAVEDWTARGLQRVYVDGGRLISSFLADDLIDDLTITVVPILLGGGSRLFHEIQGPVTLSLREARALPGGMAQLSYDRTRA